MYQFTTSQEPANQDPMLDGVTLMTGYVFRAFRRHVFLAAICFFATIGLTVGLLSLISPTYRVETRILAKNNELMSLLTATGRVLPGHATPSPTEGVVEMIRSRDTLTWLAGELDLLHRWEATRTRAGRLLDVALARALGAPTPEERYRSLLEVLEDRIDASVEGGLITIAVEWHEPEGALLVGQALHERFLSRVRSTEVDQIRTTVQILEDRAARARTAVASAAKAFEKAADRANSMTARVFRLQPPAESPDVETVARLERELEKKREALRRIESAYESRVSEAEATLNRLRATLGSAHPDVGDAERNLSLQARVPAGLADLRAEESRLSSQLTRLMPQITAAQLFERMAYASIVDPALETARERYRQASEEYGEVSERLEAARVELASADAGFAYRYIVTQPPVAPRAPSAPDVPVVLASGILAAAVLSFIIAVLADALSGRIQEAWQIVRYVGLPVLGEVHRSGSRA